VKKSWDKAVGLGITTDYARTLQRIVKRLSTDPLALGDPLRWYQAAKVFKRQWLYERIFTIYAVHEEAHVVWVLECRPVLGHPLEPSS
jgi:hypothetical protein